MASPNMMALRAGGIIAGGSAVLTAIPTGYASLVWPAATKVLHLPAAQRLSAWMPALGHAATAWVSLHAYLPWTAWSLTAQHPVSLVGIAAGLSTLIGLIATVKIAHSNGAFSRFGGPPGTGKGEHGTAHWRGMSGPGGIPEGYALWTPPKPPKPERPALDRPKATLMLPPSQSVVADRIAADYHAGKIRVHPDAKRPPKAPETISPSGLVVGLARQKPAQGAYVLDKDEHALVLGSTGAGKTRRLILPSIGVTGTAKRESLLISDPKGEVVRVVPTQR